jgi:peptidyl-prolyl cis-trans isomerase SurA
MNRLFYIRALCLAGAVCLAATLAFAGDTVIQEIVARVNNQIITRAELQRSREQLLNEMRQQGISESDPRAAEAEKNLLRDLIDLQLLVQKGQDLGITADTELVKKLDEMRKQFGLDSMEALEKEAQKQGISYEDFKQNLKNEIIRSQVIQREVGGHITVSQEEQKQFYEEHRAEMEQPEQVRLSEILVAPQAKEGEEASQEAITAAEQKAQQALAEIKGGKSFNEVAQKYSSGPTASQGGDLGYFKRGTLAKELETLTFGMKTGELSDVIRTKQGFVILKVDEHMQAGVPPFKNVEGQIGEQIYYKKLQPALREYLTKLREDAFIDIRSGYVDSGASPNQTKPVITTASTAQDTGKEKTKKKKKLGVF